MAEEAKAKSDTLFYAYVDSPGEHPIRQSIIVYQKPKRTVGDDVMPEKSRILDCNADGLFVVQKNDPDIKDIKAVMDKNKTALNKGRKNPVLIGPFDDLIEIKKARIDQRPKTAEERVAMLEAEKAELSRKLEEAEKSKSSDSSKDGKADSEPKSKTEKGK